MYRPKTIRAQMLSAVGAVTLLILLLLVGVALSVSQHQLYALGENNARDQVEAVAARAGFASIVGAAAPGEAHRLMDETVGRNGVLSAALLDLSGRALAALESYPGGLARCDFGKQLPERLDQTTSARLGDVWCVSAPVFIRSTSGTCTERQCVIGRLHVVASTQRVETVVRRLIAAILSMGSVLLTAALFLLWRVSSRISSPLRDIAQVMRRFSAGDHSARALESGPDEARTISRIYNDLIERQEHQARTLEETVEVRTRELREATLAAQDAERYKTTFMAHISHNMRTPLHVIQAQASEVMQELEFWSGSSRARSHLAVLQRQTHELALRVTQVLQLVRGDAAKDAIQIESVSLADLGNAICDKFQPLAKLNGNHLLVHADQANILADLDKIVQILESLVDNACKYTSHGTIEVRLTYDSSWLVIQVHDTGVGIPEHALPHVWREFRQVQSVDGRRVEGFGLGLAIVRRYTTLLGGSCDLSSTVGRGTTLSVRVPAERLASAMT